MKKVISILLLVCLMTGASALALTDAERDALAAPYIPEGAVFQYEKLDDGLTELGYRSGDGKADYEIKLDADGRVRKVSFDLRHGVGGANKALSETEAFAIVAALHDGATLISARAERDDGRYEYEVEFASPSVGGKYTLSAEDGTVMEYELYPVYAPVGVAASAYEILSAKYPGVEIRQAERDTDDGRETYEGDAVYQGKLYEFEIDIKSGGITKWELDD